jgi:hypothetical protein
MTGEKLREFMRRLTAEGYEPDLDEYGAGTVRDGEQVIKVMDDGEIHFMSESRAFAYRVRDIRDEVDEYMTAFIAAAPGIERFLQGGKEDIRTLINYAGYELAGRQCSDGSMDFVTWALVRGHRDMGHYTDSYADAKEDFALRCGLIDKRKMLTETQLKVVRGALSEYLTIDGGDHLSIETEKAFKSIIGQINEVIPEVEEQADADRDQGIEPELDL